jgi:inhibitor of cysteine peptidase
MKHFVICAIIMGLVFGMVEIGIPSGSRPKKNMGNNPKLIPLTIADSSRTINAVVGDTLDLVLESIPGTGYQWQIDSIDSTMLMPTRLPRPLAPERPYRVGEPVPFYLALIAVAPGHTILRLVYKRSWEKDVPPAKTFEINIDIKSDGKILPEK